MMGKTNTKEKKRKPKSKTQIRKRGAKSSIAENWWHEPLGK